VEVGNKMKVKEYTKTVSDKSPIKGDPNYNLVPTFTTCYDFEYKPTENLTKYIRFWFPEHAKQFESLLIEAGYTCVS
jgi:hypothetical protein